MQLLKEYTATAILIGPFLDETDGTTAEDAIAASDMDLDIYKHSDSHPLSQVAVANEPSHIANGYYSLVLEASEVDTLGRLTVTADGVGALPVWHEYQVIASEVYNAFHGTDYLHVDVREIQGAQANKIADHTIRRTFENACDSSDGDTKAGRSLLGAIAKLVNKVAAAGGTLTVYEDDDTTSLFTQTLTTDSGADPITEIDTD